MRVNTSNFEQFRSNNLNSAKDQYFEPLDDFPVSNFSGYSLYKVQIFLPSFRFSAADFECTKNARNDTFSHCDRFLCMEVCLERTYYLFLNCIFERENHTMSDKQK